MKPREIAIRILAGDKGPDTFIEDRLGIALAKQSLSPADRSLVQEIVYGVVRWKSLLDWQISRKTRPGAQNPLVQNLLRAGLYQLFWLDRIPPYAVVHETIEMAKAMGLGAKAGFLNAVLRAYEREQEQTRAQIKELRQTRPALAASHPEWLFERWKERWGAGQAIALMDWNNVPPLTYARLNALRGGAADLESAWTREKICFDPRSWDWTKSESVYELTDHPPLHNLPSFKEGKFYVQDPSTLLAVQVLGPQPGENILDLCAAPGGKTTLIAQRMHNQGHLIAEDIQSGRVKRIQENCQRLGVTCVEARQTPSVDRPSAMGHFNRILIDAPCSNTGVMRRRVELRWRVSSREIQRLTEVQLKLLVRAAPLLKPGGTLVYSTCSLEPEENGQVISQFRERFPNFRLNYERQLLPFQEGVDGAYVARLVAE